jgi:sortase (surface protein transpeptidase)
VEVPEDPDIAGWYTGGPRPGEVGPAAIIGHVDSHTGAGIFHRLGELRPGDDVHVRRADGTVASFLVERVEQYPKDAFPTERVYGNTDRSELRLITCGGEFDRGERSYTDNIVVYAQSAA